MELINLGDVQDNEVCPAAKRSPMKSKMLEAQSMQQLADFDNWWEWKGENQKRKKVKYFMVALSNS